MFSERTVTVVTAATGHKNLAKGLFSVQRQTYPHVEHVVVIDGLPREAEVNRHINELTIRTKPVRVVPLPHVTGAQAWNGHRMYAAMSFLVNTEFICFLDEDNWYEPDHVESLLGSIVERNAVWGFALRNLYDVNGQFIGPDLCDNLGCLHPVFDNPNDYQVDTSCYMLRRDVAAGFAPIWYRPTNQPSVLNEPDHLLCRTLLQQQLPVASNLRHTVNYTVGSRPQSAQAQWFLHGNAQMRARYPQGFPWEPKKAG
jgi:hypothetical protein